MVKRTLPVISEFMLIKLLKIWYETLILAMFDRD